MLAQIFVVEGQLVLDLVVDGPGNEDTTRVGQALQPRRHVDPITVDLLALDHGLTLRDATPYNVQFVGTRPVFIDLGSFEPGADGGPWAAYTQFCRLFLYPLLLSALTGVPAAVALAR